jgi:hypothetical protein
MSYRTPVPAAAEGDDSLVDEDKAAHRKEEMGEWPCYRQFGGRKEDSLFMG